MSQIDKVAYELRAYTILQQEFDVLKKELEKELYLLFGLYNAIDTIMVEKQ